MSKTKKQTWIKIRSGLLDPKHMETLGNAVWLFMWLIDHADWDTGTVSDYTDDWPVADWQNKKSKPTIRKWRKILEDNLYIKFIQGQHSHEIVINRWINPRSYSGDVLNQGDKKQALSAAAQGDKKRKAKSEGDIQGDTQGKQKVAPLHLSSQESDLTQDAAAEQLAKDIYKTLYDEIMQATGLDPKIRSNASQIGKLAKELREAGYTPKQFAAAYLGERSWWAVFDWRGKKGSNATLKQIRDTIGIAVAWIDKMSTAAPAPGVGALRSKVAKAQSEVANDGT